MIATEAILVIALCLAVVAAVGVRVALSLKDIGTSLDRIAEALEGGSSALGRKGASIRTGKGPAPAGEAAPDDGTLPSEQEIAAVIATAARYSKQSEEERT